MHPPHVTFYYRVLFLLCYICTRRYLEAVCKDLPPKGSKAREALRGGMTLASYIERGIN